jgi:hypothetical protein
MPKHKITKGMMDWLLGRDTGISSKTMLYMHVIGKYPDYGDIPYDPDDFGRCYRLIQQFPEIKKSFPKICMISESWKRLIFEWQELETLYIKELHLGDAPKLYNRIKEITEGK